MKIVYSLLGMLSLVATAQTTFDKAVATYEKAEKPTLQELKKEMLWAGHVVTAGNYTLGGAFMLYPSSDPLSQQGLYAVDAADQDQDYFLQLSGGDAMRVYHDSHQMISHFGFTALSDSGDPLSKELTYTVLNGGIHSAVRKTTENGTFMYLVSTWCAKDECGNSFTGEKFQNGDRMAIIYVWDQRLP